MNVDEALSLLRKYILDSIDGSDNIPCDWTNSAADRVLEIIDEFREAVTKPREQKQ